jgi:hypothetical protein
MHMARTFVRLPFQTLPNRELTAFLESDVLLDSVFKLLWQALYLAMFSPLLLISR